MGNVPACPCESGSLDDVLDESLRFAVDHDGEIPIEELRRILGDREEIVLGSVADVLEAMGIRILRKERKRPATAFVRNSAGMYLHQLSQTKMLDRDQEKALFQVIETANDKVREIFSKYLFAPEMCLHELDCLAKGMRRFDSIVAEGAAKSCAAYKKTIPDLCRRVLDASDKLSGASTMRLYLSSESDVPEEALHDAEAVLLEARAEMRQELRRLSFRQDVIEALCDAANEDIYLPYIGCRRQLERAQPSQAEGIAEKMRSLEALFGMSPDEFIQSFGELRRAMKAAQSARARIVEANLRLVVYVAKKYVGRGCEFLDLLQDGSIGLMTAVRQFDRSRGHKFSTFATWWIRQKISRSLTNNSRTVRIPAHMVDALNKLNNVEKALTQSLGREPADREIAARMGITKEKLSQLRKFRQMSISLDSSIRGDDDTTYGDLMSDERSEDAAEETERLQVKEKVRDALSGLTERERLVIDLRYGLSDGCDRTLEEIGRVFNVTREHIRQVEIGALAKLRESGQLMALAEHLRT